MHQAFRRAAGASPIIYAHRGASALEPENTMRAFARAFDDGADALELDIRLASTGEVIVFHDPTLDRVAHRPGRVRTMSLAALQREDLGKGERIPTLNDVLDLVASRNRLVNIEAKSDDVDRIAVARALAATLGSRTKAERERMVFSTFHPRLLVLLRTFVREIPCALLFEEDLRGRLLGWAAPHLWTRKLLHPNHNLITPRNMLRWQRAGIIVNTWTVDNSDELQRVSALGVDGVITNDPARTLAVFRR